MIAYLVTKESPLIKAIAYADAMDAAMDDLRGLNEESAMFAHKANSLRVLATASQTWSSIARATCQCSGQAMIPEEVQALTEGLTPSGE